MSQFTSCELHAHDSRSEVSKLFHVSVPFLLMMGIAVQRQGLTLPDPSNVSVSFVKAKPRVLVRCVVHDLVHAVVCDE